MRENFLYIDDFVCVCFGGLKQASVDIPSAASFDMM